MFNATGSRRVSGNLVSGERRILGQRIDDGFRLAEGIYGVGEVALQHLRLGHDAALVEPEICAQRLPTEQEERLVLVR